MSIQRPWLASPFSTTSTLREKQGTGNDNSMAISVDVVLIRASISVDEELVAKLQSEIELEIPKDDESEYPLSVKEYLENGSFRVCFFSRPWAEVLKFAKESPCDA
jgi:hypothetical protein